LADDTLSPFELIVEQIKQTNEPCFNFFLFLCLLPQGGSEKIITNVLGTDEWDIYRENLERASLLNWRSASNKMEIYYLLPYIATKAEKLLEKIPSLYFDYHLKICTYFYEKLLSIMEYPE